MNERGKDDGAYFNCDVGVVLCRQVTLTQSHKDDAKCQGQKLNPVANHGAAAAVKFGIIIIRTTQEREGNSVDSKVA